MPIRSLLIKAVDAAPSKESAGYKKGDIISFAPLGREYGRKESLPLFLVVKIAVTPEEEVELQKPELSELLDTRGMPIEKNKAKYNYEFDKHLGSTIMKKISESGWNVQGIEKRHIKDKSKPDRIII